MVKIYQTPFADSGDKQAIPVTTDPQGFVSDETGFTGRYELPDTDPSYLPIERAEMNGVLNEITEGLGEIQQFGFAKWQAGTWPQGARCVEGGVVYRALTATNKKPPHADWVVNLPLSLGTAATRNVGVNSGNVMVVGAFGLGTDSYAPGDTLLGGGSRIVRRQFDPAIPGVAGHSDRSPVLIMNSGGHQSWIQITDQGLYFQWEFGATSLPTFKRALDNTNVAQTTGQSTQSVMSQKAVTDELDEKITGGSVVQGTGTSDTNVMSQKAVTDILGQPSMSGTITTNGTTNNTLALTAIVSKLGLEVGDVIRVNYSGYNKLHTVESITNDNSIIVNYEHAGNRGNGSLKLANTTASATITRIAKWYNAPIGLGQEWLVTTALRSSGVTYSYLSTRRMAVSVNASIATNNARNALVADGVTFYDRTNGGSLPAGMGVASSYAEVHQFSAFTDLFAELR